MFVCDTERGIYRWEGRERYINRENESVIERKWEKRERERGREGTGREIKVSPAHLAITSCIDYMCYWILCKLDEGILTRATHGLLS